MRSDPLILGFDTSAAHCAAALLSGNTVLAASHEGMIKGQAERLFPLLEETLTKAGATWADLSALAVGTGPGNFTGIRISVSAARGLSPSLGIPAIGVTLLDAVAQGSSGPTLACLDARGGKAYVQLHGRDALPDIAPQLIDTTDLPAPLIAELSKGDVTCVGSAAETIAPLINAPTTPAAYPPAEAIARIAATRDAKTAPRPAPYYIRPADAAPARDTPPVIVP